MYAQLLLQKTVIRSTFLFSLLLTDNFQNVISTTWLIVVKNNVKWSLITPLDPNSNAKVFNTLLERTFL